MNCPDCGKRMSVLDVEQYVKLTIRTVTCGYCRIILETEERILEATRKDSIDLSRVTN